MRTGSKEKRSAHSIRITVYAVECIAFAFGIIALVMTRASGLAYPEILGAMDVTDVLFFLTLSHAGVFILILQNGLGSNPEGYKNSSEDKSLK